MPLIHNPSLAIGRTARFRAFKRVTVDTQNLQVVIDTAKSNVGSIDSDAQKAKTAINDLPTNLQTAISSFQEQISAISKNIGEVKNNATIAHDTLIDINQKPLKETDTNVNKILKETKNILLSFEQLKATLDEIKPFPSYPESFPDEQIESLWVCERTLHRVEQIVTDKDITNPDLKYLERFIQKSKSHPDPDDLISRCRTVLKDNSVLAEGINSIHRGFKKSSPPNEVRKERYERFVEIQQLRQGIVAYLSKKKSESEIQ